GHHRRLRSCPTRRSSDLAMYLRAYAKREDLGLNEVEVIDTRESIYDNVFVGAFGIISLVLAHFAPQFAGVVYFLIAIPKTIVPWVMGVKRRRVEEQLIEEAE